MTDSKLLATFSLMLHGEARSFFATKVRRLTHKFDDAMQKIDAQFNSSTSQQCVKKYLFNLKFNQFLGANDKPTNAFVKLVMEID